ncbi:Kelch repeat-containing protein [Streptomyces aureocirculatus]|uniref:sialidase family protein n=1 Tax=Streptomyces aureocirculatus TaxID=67275 RepID=UPI00068F30FC|nr:sialidase family protein [Streptomyces aureocirculatus]
MERLRAQMQGQPVSRRARRLAAGPKDTRLLYGVLLRAAARLDAGHELTDLEGMLLAPLAHMLSQDEIREMGRVYAEAGSMRHAPEMFPQAVSARTLADGFSLADLLKELPAAQDVSGQPNIRVVDVASGTPLDSEEFAQAEREAGYGLTVVDSSDQGDQEAAASPTFHARIDLEKFYCKDDTNESTRDEIYWTIASSSEPGKNRAYRTREYGSVVQGSTREFDGGTVLFDGLLSKHTGCHISCWEADDSPDGFYAELARKLHIIADELFRFLDILEKFPSGHWENHADWIKFAAMVAQLIAYLIDWLRNDDDLVEDRKLVFTRAALSRLNGTSDYWNFRGDGGHFHLYLKFSVRGDTRILTNTSTGSTWTADATITGSTLGAPAVAVYGDKLYGMIRGGDSEGALYWNRHDGTSWNRYTKLTVPYSPNGPALAAYNNKLYAAYTHYGSPGFQVSWSHFDGQTWAAFTSLPTEVRTLSTPALAAHNGKLYCMIRKAIPFQFGSTVIYLDGNELSWGSFDGRTWSTFITMPNYSSSTPAMAVFNNTLYTVHHGTSDGALYWSTLSGTTWRPFQKFPSGSTRTTPALAVHNGKLYCMVRGADSDSLSWATFNGTTWTGFTRVDTLSSMAPALASLGGKLHCVHRG